MSTEKLPKGVNLSQIVTSTLTAKCTACKKSHTAQLEGKYSQVNVKFQVREALKFTTIETDRDLRTGMGVTFLLCPECNDKAQRFMRGLTKGELDEAELQEESA